MNSYFGSAIKKGLSLSFILIAFSLSAQQVELVKRQPKKAVTQIELSMGPGFVYVHKSSFLVENRDPKIGFCSSIGVIHSFSNRIEGAANFQYETKGYAFTATTMDEASTPPVNEKVTERVKLKYVSLNLAPRIAIGKNRKGYISAGPYLAYFLGWKFYQEYYRNDVLIDKNSSTLYADENYKKYDFGLMAAVGYSIRINQKFHGFIQLRYNLGLVNINQPMIDPLRTNAIYLLLGIALHK